MLFYHDLISLYGSAHHRHLHSFPTRRSSDLGIIRTGVAADDGQARESWLLENAGRAGTARRIYVQSGRQFGLSDDGGSTSPDRKSTRLNSSHRCISYAVFCLKKKK